MSSTRFTRCTLIFLLILAGCKRGSVPEMVGREAPTFSVSDADRTVNLKDLRGKIVVLNFWATWCPPCVQEMPSLIAMQQSTKDRVVVLAVSTDEDEAAYQKFLRTHGLYGNLLTVRDSAQKSNTLYGTFRFPETYIIDRNGILRRKFIGPVEWTRPEILEYLEKL
jgi:cytochrome c biogenesis protein CcmG, thiol:disulfide interchange protein DsbE